MRFLKKLSERIDKGRSNELWAVRTEKRGLINLHRERSDRAEYISRSLMLTGYTMDRPCPPKDLYPRRDTDVVFYPFYFILFSLLYSFIFYFPRGTTASNKFLFVQVAGFDKAARENMASPSIPFRSMAFLRLFFFFFFGYIKMRKRERNERRN